MTEFERRLEANERAELEKLNRNTRVRLGLETPPIFSRKRSRPMYRYQRDRQFDRSFI